MVKEVTDATFDEEVLKSDQPVMVDFWAEWCGPCKALAPVIEELANENGDKIKILKMNIDQNPDTAPKFGIRGIPTNIIFKNGEVFEQITGNQAKSKFQDSINKL
jgi:thioredoxin 1